MSVSVTNLIRLMVLDHPHASVHQISERLQEQGEHPLMSTISTTRSCVLATLQMQRQRAERRRLGHVADDPQRPVSIGSAMLAKAREHGLRKSSRY